MMTTARSSHGKIGFGAKKSVYANRCPKPTGHTLGHFYFAL
jgi:hypothetical protein